MIDKLLQKPIQTASIAHTHPAFAAGGGAHAGSELRLRYPEHAHPGRSRDRGQQLHGCGHGGLNHPRITAPTTQTLKA